MAANITVASAETAMDKSAQASEAQLSTSNHAATSHESSEAEVDPNAAHHDMSPQPTATEMAAVGSENATEANEVPVLDDAPAQPSLKRDELKTSTSSQQSKQKRPDSMPVPDTPTADQYTSGQLPLFEAEPTTPTTSSRNRVSTGSRDSVAKASAFNSVILTDFDASNNTSTSATSSLVTSGDELEQFSDAQAGSSATSASPGKTSSMQLNSQDQAHTRASTHSGSSGSSNKDYGFLQQRAEEASVAMAEPLSNGKRRSQMVNAEIRASFQRMREDAEHFAQEGETSAFVSPDNSASNDYANGIQAIDWDLWGRIMSDYEDMARNSPRELSKAIQNGIPPALRGMMWQLMSASKDPELETVYSRLMRESSPHDKQIARDLNRTFPSHEYFKTGSGVGQGNLLNVVKAYSLYDEEVGYCQGMAFVVGPLLLNMPDEEAFCVLVRLMKAYDLRSQYLPDMPGLQLRLFQFDRLLEELLPAVFMHLLRQGIKSSMYASQWFLTLLAYRFPLELVCSVFDLIFAEGVEAIFRFAIALMKRNEAHLLTLDFEKLLDFLKTGLFEHYKLDLEKEAGDDDASQYCARTFLREALFVKITPMMLDQFANEWAEMCRQQSAQNQEIEQLRNINKKLSQQVRGLEGSLAQINQEHCELVKQVVQIRLEKEELEDELVKCKMALAQESLLREEGRGSRGSLASFVSMSSMASPIAEVVEIAPDQKM